MGCCYGDLLKTLPRHVRKHFVKKEKLHTFLDEEVGCILHDSHCVLRVVDALLRGPLEPVLLGMPLHTIHRVLLTWGEGEGRGGERGGRERERERRQGEGEREEGGRGRERGGRERERREGEGEREEGGRGVRREGEGEKRGEMHIVCIYICLLAYHTQ